MDRCEPVAYPPESKIHTSLARMSAIEASARWAVDECVAVPMNVTISPCALPCAARFGDQHSKHSVNRLVLVLEYTMLVFVKS